MRRRLGRPGFSGRRLLALALVTLGNVALAQAWTVQTVALRDLRDARSVVDDLRSFDLDAYTEFAMNDGQQFVRVRIGCFVSREGAEALAAVLRGRVTADAAAVELTSGAPVMGCVRVDVGFRKPYEWEAVEGAGALPAFRVVVAGVPARIVHDGSRWAVLQGDGAVPSRDPQAATATFDRVVLGGVPLVRWHGEDGAVVLCPGEVIGSVGDVAIVELGDLVMACSLHLGRGVVGAAPSPRPARVGGEHGLVAAGSGALR